MAIYKYKISSRIFKSYLPIFFAIFYFYVFTSSGDFFALGLAIASTIIAIIVHILTTSEIITDTNGIKIITMGRLHQECQWDLIGKVKTVSFLKGWFP